MATIRFDPTTVYVYKDYEFDHEGDPLEVNDNSPFYESILWFDTTEILKVLKASRTQASSYFTAESLDNNYFLFIQEMSYDNPDKNVYPYPDIVWWSGDIENTGIFRKDISREKFGPPYRTLGEAIENDGLTGFGLTSADNSVEGSFKLQNASVEIEGDWTNHRPSLKSPVGGETKNLNEDLMFEWDYYGALDQKEFELRYRVKGTTAWTTVTESSNSHSHILDANTLSENDYEWQVRTTSEHDFVSPWSSIGIFRAAVVTPTPEITYPKSTEDVPVSDFTAEWTSVDQYEYELELLQGTDVIYQKSAISTDQQIEKADILENNTTYKVRLRVNQENGLWSAWAEVEFNVSYTEPAKPTIIFDEDVHASGIAVYIENPEPTGTEPRVVNQDLYRRVNGGDWIKLASKMERNSSYHDYAVASGQSYEYRVYVRGDNDTSTYSDVYSHSIKFDDAILAQINGSYVRLLMNPSRSFSYNFAASNMKFAGRKRPVTEFEETISNDFSLDYLVNEDDLMTLQEIAQSQQTVLYRDRRGRKLYSTISGLTINDDMRLLTEYPVSLSLSEVDYIEGVD